MGFKIITPPAALLTLAELHLHLRIDDNAIEDTLLLATLEAARDYAQHYTSRAIGVQTIELALDAFPKGGIDMPLTPVNAVASVKYIDVHYVEQTLPLTAYMLDDYGTNHWLLPAANSVWPNTAPVANSVKVNYTAGSLPASVRAGMLLMIGHLYENRENLFGKQEFEFPIGVHALLDTAKAWRI